jgi:hypothetical protein
VSREDDIEFQKVFMEGLVPRIEGSAIGVSICPTSPDRLDAKFCTELGAMVMMDKPIIAVLGPEAATPVKLSKIADKIIYADIETAEGQQKITREIKEFLDE